MITYNPAFDLYHCIFRMAHIVNKLEDGESFETDKVRIWDFYLLFPDKTYGITIRRDEEEIRKLREGWIVREDNPYENCGDNRKFLEWIKPVQVSALGCLVSCGILNKEQFESGLLCIDNRETLKSFLSEAGSMSGRERNVLSFMHYLSRKMSMTGLYGLKARTKLLESRYDAE